MRVPGTLGGGSGLRTLGIRSRKGDFRFGERDRHGADKRGSRNGEHVKRDRGFESISLQQTVRLSPASAFEGREPRLSARVSAAGLATGSAETRRVFRYRANPRPYLCL